MKIGSQQAHLEWVDSEKCTGATALLLGEKIFPEGKDKEGDLYVRVDRLSLRTLNQMRTAQKLPKLIMSG